MWKGKSSARLPRHPPSTYQHSRLRQRSIVRGRLAHAKVPMPTRYSFAACALNDSVVFELEKSPCETSHHVLVILFSFTPWLQLTSGEKFPILTSLGSVSSSANWPAAARIASIR